MTAHASSALEDALDFLAERGASKAKPWTPDELAAQIDPVVTFLRSGVDALKPPRETSRSR
jgi:hypothetical protein